MTNAKQINSLLAIIRDEKNSIKERSFALKKLESEINTPALEDEVDFEASFSAFEQQWSQFEETMSVFTNGFEDVDDEVNQLIQHEGETIRREKKDNTSSSSEKIDTEIKDLERRLQDLHDFSMDDLERRLHSLHQFKVESHERKPNVLNVPIKTLEKKLSLFEAPDEKSHQVEPSDPLNVSGLDKDDTPYVPRNSINLPTAPVQITVIPKVDKMNIFAVFINQFKALIQSAGYFIKKLGNKSISLPEATEKLNITQAQLGFSMGKLNDATNYFRNIRDELATQHKILSREFTKYSQMGKNIPKIKVLLKQIKSSNDVDKDKKIKDLEGRLLSYESLGSDIRKMTHQLNKVNQNASAVYKNLQNTALMHEMATKRVTTAMKELEQVLDREELIKNQHRIKDVLSDYRKESEKVKKLMDSVEEISIPSYPKR